MPQSGPSFVYNDPAIGAIANNLGHALFGDPDKAAHSEYYRAHSDQAKATAADTRSKTDARGRAAAGLASLFQPADPGADPRATIQSRLAGVGGPMFEAGDNGAAQQLTALASLFMGLQPGGDSARNSLVLTGHAPDKNFAPDQATATANATRDSAAEFARTKYSSDSSAGAQRYSADSQASTSRANNADTNKTTIDVANIHEAGANKRDERAPVILGRDQELHGTRGAPTVKPTATGAPSSDSVKADGLSALFGPNPPDYSDDQRRALGLQVKEGAERDGRVIKLAPDQIAVDADGKMIAEGKPGNSVRAGAKPVRLGPYDTLVGPDGKVLHEGQKKPDAATKALKVDPKMLDAAEARIAEALGVDGSDLAKMVSQLSAPELEQYNTAVAKGFQDGGNIPGAVTGGANVLRQGFKVTPGRIWGHNIERIAPGAAPAPAAPAAPSPSIVPPAVAAPAQLQPPPADPAQRQKGATYQTPKGAMTWTGTGWVPAQPGA
jgi:hypothetical protein